MYKKKRLFPEEFAFMEAAPQTQINVMNGTYLFCSVFFFFCILSQWRRTALLCVAVCFMVVNTTTSHREGRSKGQNGGKAECCWLLYFITKTNSSPASIGDTGTLSLQSKSIVNRVLKSKMDLEEPRDDSSFKTDLAKKVLLFFFHPDSFLLKG